MPRVATYAPEGRQTAEHILLTCNRYQDDREATWNGEPMDLPLILTQRDTAVKAAKFMLRTELLKVFQDVSVEEEVEEN